MTTMLRNRLFLKGIVFGSILGVLTGSLVAFQVGSNRDVVKASFSRLTRRKQQLDYSKLMV